VRLNQNQQVILIFCVFILIAAINVEMLMLSCTIAFQVVLLNQIVQDWKTYKKAKSLPPDAAADQYRGDWVVKAMFFFLVTIALFVLDYVMVVKLIEGSLLHPQKISATFQLPHIIRICV
jgi:hypothetical protein